MAVKTYRDLIAWQRAMDLVVDVASLTKAFPKDEQYGLTNQARRAAVSIPSNIAEGQGRGIGAEFAHHLRISQGSLQELETQLRIGERLGYVSKEKLASVLLTAEEAGRLVRGLHKSVR